MSTPQNCYSNPCLNDSNRYQNPQAKEFW